MKNTAEDMVKIFGRPRKKYMHLEKEHQVKRIKPGDWICFYATTNGIVAHAQVDSYPEKNGSSKTE